MKKTIKKHSVALTFKLIFSLKIIFFTSVYLLSPILKANTKKLSEVEYDLFFKIIYLEKENDISFLENYVIRKDEYFNNKPFAGKAILNEDYHVLKFRNSLTSCPIICSNRNRLFHFDFDYPVEFNHGYFNVYKLKSDLYYSSLVNSPIYKLYLEDLNEVKDSSKLILPVVKVEETNHLTSLEKNINNPNKINEIAQFTKINFNYDTAGNQISRTPPNESVTSLKTKIEESVVENSETKSNEEVTSFEKSIIVYPNPTKGMVYLQWSDNLNINVEDLVITDAVNRLIINKIIKDKVNAEIDLGPYTRGAFILTFTLSDGTKVVKKIIKQ